MKKLMFALFAFGLFCSQAFASNITYTATRGVGTGTVSLSITTDGAFGVLSAANMVDWTIGMTDGPDSYTLYGPLGSTNSTALIIGSALTATATDLLFDYSSGGTNLALFQHPSTGSGQTFWCVQTNGCFDFAGPGEAIDPRFDFSFVKTAHSGNLVIASTSPVPEPETYAMMMAGLGLLGFAARRRKLKEPVAA